MIQIDARRVSPRCVTAWDEISGLFFSFSFLDGGVKKKNSEIFIYADEKSNILVTREVKKIYF